MLVNFKCHLSVCLNSGHCFEGKNVTYVVLTCSLLTELVNQMGCQGQQTTVYGSDCPAGQPVPWQIQESPHPQVQHGTCFPCVRRSADWKDHLSFFSLWGEVDTLLFTDLCYEGWFLLALETYFAVREVTERQTCLPQSWGSFFSSFRVAVYFPN